MRLILRPNGLQIEAERESEVIAKHSTLLSLDPCRNGTPPFFEHKRKLKTPKPERHTVASFINGTSVPEIFLTPMAENYLFFLR
ncbi:hypothetical protein TNCV_4820051 [Trichonephila clavipes]|nr:hypothetical protein TNCV_4820051 [Trichonephila clavipes]